VIVIDDGTNTPVAQVVISLRDRLNLTLLTQQNQGPASARNTGASKARGRYLAFTDDDCVLAPDWLQKLAVLFDSYHNCVIGGRTINALPDNAYSTASQDLVSYIYEYYNADKNKARFLASNNLAVPTEPFYTLGGFDPKYPIAAAEDRDLCYRWQLCGHSMIYAPEAIVYHRHHLRLKTFWKQHFGYGRGAFQFQQARFRCSRKSIRFEPLSFYVNLMLYPVLKGKSQRPLLITFLLILSQISNAAGFLWD